MPPQTSNPHITKPSHNVQFYEHDSFLIEKLRVHIEEGLALGEGVIVIATPPHRDALAACLNGQRQQDRYIEVDAAETLAQFMSGDGLDRERFRTVIGKLIRQAANAGNGRIRAFGEMVALLWEDGQHENALHLESLWNELAAYHSFSLLCAYPIRDFSSQDHTHLFQKICSSHSSVRAAEHASIPGPWDSRDDALTLATLQQKAVALEGETARRKVLQSILSQREEELADFLENAVECVHQVGPDGIIIWANKAELAFLGYERHEYIGHSIEEFHVDQPVIQDILQRLLRKETLHDYPARLRCKDGSIKEVLIHSNVRWDNDTFRYTRCFTRDITERKRIEQELDRRVEERTRDLVESQQKLRALAAELSLAERRVRKDIATELHDYLAQLLIVTRLKLGQATQEAEEHVKIRQMLKEADDVLNESIMYTRTLMAELNPPVLEFGLSMGLRWLAENFQRHNLAVETSIPEGLELNLSANQIDLLFQSVRELLMNVVKHAKIDRARISLRKHENMICLEVTDQGVGFDAGSFADRPWGSEGLKNFGLFSIRERMEILGGRFELHSTPEQGTRVLLMIPLQPGSQELPLGDGISGTTVQEEQASHNGADSIRILLVDDHTVVREGLRGVLTAYQDILVVAEAGDGEEAISQAERHLPDVVIMDINLPKLDGIEATRRIKSRFPKIIVIGLSVHQANQIEPSLLEAGGSAYLNKDAAGISLYDTILSAVQKLRFSQHAASR